MLTLLFAAILAVGSTTVLVAALARLCEEQRYPVFVEIDRIAVLFLCYLGLVAETSKPAHVDQI